MNFIPLEYPAVFWNGNNIEEIELLFPKSIVDMRAYITIDNYSFLQYVWLFNINNVPHGFFDEALNEIYNGLQ